MSTSISSTDAIQSLLTSLGDENREQIDKDKFGMLMQALDLEELTDQYWLELLDFCSVSDTSTTVLVASDVEKMYASPEYNPDMATVALMSELKLVFSLLDTAGRGYIHVDEFIQGLWLKNFDNEFTGTSLQHLDTDTLLRVIKSADIKGNGTLEFVEFCAAVLKIDTNSLSYLKPVQDNVTQATTVQKATVHEKVFIGSRLDKGLLKRGINNILSDQAAFEKRWLTSLFETYPETKALFDKSTKVNHLKLILDMLAKIVDSADCFEEMVPRLQRLGVKHVQMGIKFEYFEHLMYMILETLQSTDCDEWVDLFALVYYTMMTAKDIPELMDNQSLAVGHMVEGSHANPMLDPTKTSGEDFVRYLKELALSHKAVSHPYLNRLSNGDLPDMNAALSQLLQEYSHYGKRFVEFVSMLLNASSDRHRHMLEEDLASELGELEDDDRDILRQAGIDPSALEGVPHKVLFQQMKEHVLKACGSDGSCVVRDEDGFSPGEVFVREVESILQASTHPARFAALGVATECIVPTLYKFFISAIQNHTDLPPNDYAFLILHVYADTKHGATMEGMVADLATCADTRAQMLQAVKAMLEARVGLWDRLLSSILQPQSVARTTTTETGTTLTSDTKPPQEDPEALYDETSSRWVRTKPNCLSDFTARPYFFTLCQPHIAKSTWVLDIGCGEGYSTRGLRDFGADNVVGVDISEKMIKLASRAEENNTQQQQQKIRYFHNDARSVQSFLQERFLDLGLVKPNAVDGLFGVVSAVFLFNYMSIADMRCVGKQVYSLLKPGGRFIFTVPHPTLRYWDREESPPFYLQKVGSSGYFQDRDQRVPGVIHTRDGQELHIQSVHKTLSDYFQFLCELGYVIELVQELGVDEKMMADDPEFFAGVQGLPLHVAIKVIKPDVNTATWLASTRRNQDSAQTELMNDRSLTVGNMVEGSHANPMLDPTKTSGEDFVRFLKELALSHKAVSHPYLNRLSNGDLPDMNAALSQLLQEYSHYGKRFVEFVSMLLNASSDRHRHMLEEDLASELGELEDDDRDILRQAGIDPSALEGVPHKVLFQQMKEHVLKACGSDGSCIVRDEDGFSPGEVFVREVESILQASTHPARFAALGVATECIVPTLYKFFISAIQNHTDLPPNDYAFLILHVYADTKHGATMEGMVADLATCADTRAQMLQAVKAMLEARVGLWDRLLSSILQPQSVARTTTTETGTTLTSDTKPPQEDPEALYDETSSRWVRTKPNCLSDFTARPYFFTLCQPHIAKSTWVLDIGCGEGYSTRGLRDFGADNVVGVDISEKMIKLASRAEENNTQQQQQKIRYFHNDARSVQSFLQERFLDLGLVKPNAVDGLFGVVSAVFLFNYMSIADMRCVGKQVYSLLKPGGRFIFTVPHPTLRYWDREESPPFYLQKVGSSGYFQDRDQRVPGVIHARDGQELHIQSVHKTLSDYFQFLCELGYVIELVQELGVDEKMMADDPEFFAGVQGLPLHVAIKVIKPDVNTATWLASTRRNQDSAQTELMNDRSLTVGNMVEGSHANPMLDPTKTSGEDFVRFLKELALSHKAVSHPYLNRLSNGDLPDMNAALSQLLQEYSHYGKRFVEFVSMLLNASSDRHRHMLEEDLASELGELEDDDRDILRQAGIDPSALEGVPHKVLFQQMKEHVLKACGSDGSCIVRDEDGFSPGEVFVREVESILQASTHPARFAALGVATECIVPTLYKFFISAIQNHTDLPPNDYAFLILHVYADTKHGATMEGMVADLATCADTRAQMLQAVKAMLEARVGLWDRLLSSILQPQSVARTTTTETGTTLTSDTKPPQEDPEALYDETSSRWVRTKPNCLSDFTARPYFFTLCQPHIAKSTWVLDIGCGEGYSTRGLRDFGADNVVGVDISEKMIKLASRAEENNTQQQQQKIRYFHNDARSVQSFLQERFLDLGLVKPNAVDGLFGVVSAVFLFNYMSIADMRCVGKQVYSLLKPGGRFIFTVPHPTLRYWDREESPPFYLQKVGSSGYFQDRDQRVPGVIHTRDGQELHIQSVHKTLSDYFQFLCELGYVIELVQELGVDEKMMADDPEFFAGVQGLPLHVAIKVIKPDVNTATWLASTRRNQVTAQSVQEQKKKEQSAILRGASAMDIACNDFLVPPKEIMWSCIDYGDRFILQMPDDVLQELVQSAKVCLQRGIDHTNYMPGDVWPLTYVKRFGKACANRLMRKHGNLIVRGLDVDALAETEIEREKVSKLCYYILMGCIGVIDTTRGRLFDVVDRKLDVRKDNVLFAASSQECGWHSDGSDKDWFPDMVSLLCIRPASEGGEFQISNACNAYHDLCMRLPKFLMYELLRPVVRDIIEKGATSGFGRDMVVEDPASFWTSFSRHPDILRQRARLNSYPIFERNEATKQCKFRFLDHWLYSGHKKASLRVSPLLKIAVAELDKALHRHCRFDRRLERGEIAMANNHLVAHRRNEFVDSSHESEHRRLLVRCWMKVGSQSKDE